MTAPLSHRESDERYSRVVTHLNPRWRVIECRDGLQWILQFGKASGHGTAWRGRSYCRTKSALMRVCAHHAGKIDGAALAVLEALPDRIGRAG